MAQSSALLSENWENGSGAWHVDPADAPDPIVISQDDASVSCSTKYQHETVLYGLGRVFSNASIPLTTGSTYCLTAFIRGSAGTSPFLGIVDNDDSGAPTGIIHWLLGNGSFDNGYGSSAVQVANDAIWHWYAAPFTFTESAMSIRVLDELWNGGGAGSADFDDIQLWAGACPTQPTGADLHAVCSGATPVCGSNGACGECASNTDCSGTTPVCSANVCVACGSDTDCGTATSGSICQANACVSGCRGTGGNGCPTGTVCSSTTSTAGTCGPAPQDFSVPPDFSVAPDFSIVTTPPDLSIVTTPPDLSVVSNPPDLSVVTTPPDMTGVDLNGVDMTQVVSTDLAGQHVDMAVARDFANGTTNHSDGGCSLAGHGERTNGVVFLLLCAAGMVVRRRRVFA